MNCEYVESVLSAFVENELPADELHAIGQHLSECPHCTELVHQLENLIEILPELEEDVPFFLRNRLHHIAETEESKPPIWTIIPFPKWIAVAVGTLILVFNLLYFTNIVPGANRSLHALTANTEKLIVRTGGLIEKLKESKDILVTAFFNKNTDDIKKKESSLDRSTDKGGKHG